MLASRSVETDSGQGSFDRLTERYAALSETTRLWLLLVAITAVAGVAAFVFDVIGGPGMGTDAGSRLFNLIAGFLGIYVLVAGAMLAVGGAAILAGWARRNP